MFLLAVYGAGRAIREKKNAIVKFLYIVSISLLPLVLFVQANFTHWSALYMYGLE